MAQMGEHRTRMEEVQELIPTRGNLFAEFVFVIPCILPTLFNYEKLDYKYVDENWVF